MSAIVADGRALATPKAGQDPGDGHNAVIPPVEPARTLPKAPHRRKDVARSEVSRTGLLFRRGLLA